MTEPRKELFISTARIEGPGSKDFLQKQLASGEGRRLDAAVFQEGSMTRDKLLPREIPQTEFTTFSSVESDEVLREELLDNVAFAERTHFNSTISNEAFTNQNRILPHERKYTQEKVFTSNIPKGGIERNARILEVEVPHEEIPFQRTFRPQTFVPEKFQQSDRMQESEPLYLCRMNNVKRMSQDFLLQQSACNKSGPFATPCLGEEFIEQGQQSVYYKLGPFATPSFGDGFIEEGHLSPNMTIEAEHTQVSTTQFDVDILQDPNFQSEMTLIKTKQRNPLISSEVIINKSNALLHEIKHSDEMSITSIVCKEGMIVRDNLQYHEAKAYGKSESTLRLNVSALQDNPQQHEMTHAAVGKFASCAFNEGFVHQNDGPQPDVARDTEKHVVSTEHTVGLMSQDHLLHLAAAPFGEGPFNCFLCNVRFSSKILLQGHMEIHKVKKSFICNICNTCFAENSDLLRHSKTHEGERQFSRTECDKVVSSKGNLPVQQSAQTEEYWYKCDLCDYASCRLFNLRTHQLTHTGERPHKCDLCEYASARSSDLQRHRRTHTGERPHKCDLCDYASSDSSVVREHKRTHNGELPYKCDFCDYASAYSSNFRRHRRMHHKSKSSCTETSTD